MCSCIFHHIFFTNVILNLKAGTIFGLYCG